MRIAFDATNHVAVEPLLAVAPFVLVVLLSWVGVSRARKGVRIALTAYSLASIAAIYGMDRGNVLVQYARWAERGIPERPCVGVMRHIWACRK